jgi:hypothetical protein
VEKKEKPSCVEGQPDWARVMTDPAQQTALRVFIANKTLMNRKVTAVKGMAVGRKMRATDKQREEIEHKSPSCPRATL